MKRSSVIAYKDAAAEGLLQAMESDERVFLLGEGVDGIRGVYGQTLPAFRTFGESRVIDTPLSENALTGFAVGAALAGLRPVLMHQRNDFMLLAMDQMFNQAAKLGFASGGRHTVPLTIVSFVARKAGEGVQHSQSLQAVFAHFPGVKVGMPACAEDAKGMIIAAIEDDEPVIILEHCILLDEKGFVPEERFKTPYTARVVAEGEDVTIAALSATVRDALEARSVLEKESISAEVVDVRWVRPLDTETIVRSIIKTGRLLVVDTGWKLFGVSAEIVATVSERMYGRLKSPPRRMGLPDYPCPAATSLIGGYHPTAERIAAAICEMAKPFES